MHRSLKAIGLAACIALLGACGGDESGEPGQDGPDGETQAGVEGGAPTFALVRGTDTLLIEQYTLTGNRVRGIMRDPTGSSVEYQTIHATDGGERTMQVTLRSSNPQAEPPILSTFTLRGDSAWLETTRGDSTIRNGDAVGAGALPYMSPSMGMMSLVVQSARALVGDSGQVTLLAASVRQNPVLVSPLVTWRADTAWVRGDAMNQFKLVFSNGELMSAENTPQQMRFVRVDPSAIEPRAAAAPPAGQQQPAAPPAGPPAAQ